MAEFMGNKEDNSVIEAGFAAMGKPIPEYRRSAAYEHCKQMGQASGTAWATVTSMIGPLERDKPYEAMAAGMKTLDLTGTYRVMAVLLTGEPSIKEPHGYSN